MFTFVVYTGKNEHPQWKKIESKERQDEKDFLDYGSAVSDGGGILMQKIR